VTPPWPDSTVAPTNAYGCSPTITRCTNVLRRSRTWSRNSFGTSSKVIPLPSAWSFAKTATAL
jgi:hypothetical protein